MTKIEVKNLGYSYRNSPNLVIHDINLCIEKPGLYCIIGPNGVGKSTFIKCMNKIFTPVTGQVLLDGRDIKELSLKEISSKIGYVPVTTDNVFTMPVIDAILLGRQAHGSLRTSKEDLEIVTRVMKMMGLEELSMRSFNHLSAGQHQKVAIARGIAQKTPILILDEPTANLDVKHQVYVTELLRGLAQRDGKIIIMISHDINIAAKYAHEVIVMENGTVSQVGPSEKVITEELINRIYNVDCRIVNDEGKPHVILGSVLSL